MLLFSKKGEKEEIVVWFAGARKNVLHLTLKFKWFDLIASGKKRIEYRRNCEYWRKRIRGKEVITFHRGYSNETMTFRIRKIRISE